MARFNVGLVISATFLAACAIDSGTPADDGTGGGKADGSEPTITFKSNYTQSVSGTLLAGSPVRIKYDLARLTTCRGESNNTEVWGVTGWAQFDSGAPTSFAVSHLDVNHVVPVAAELQIPASATKVAMWFSINNRWGCNAYDSNFGDNYNFTVDHHSVGAVLAFDADGTDSQSGAVHAGDKVVIHYAPDRLSECSGSTGGHAAWAVTGHWQVDGGSIHDVMVSRADGANLVAADPLVTVPRGYDLALWFEATSVWGCHAYDSAFGANYHVTIE
jgi:uncharacterized protein YraI